MNTLDTLDTVVIWTQEAVLESASSLFHIELSIDHVNESHPETFLFNWFVFVSVLHFDFHGRCDTPSLILACSFYFGVNKSQSQTESDVCRE